MIQFSSEMSEANLAWIFLVNLFSFVKKFLFNGMNKLDPIGLSSQHNSLWVRHRMKVVDWGKKYDKNEGCEAKV